MYFAVSISGYHGKVSFMVPEAGKNYVFTGEMTYLSTEGIGKGCPFCTHSLLLLIPVQIDTSTMQTVRTRN